jgi:hypothetical protein
MQSGIHALGSGLQKTAIVLGIAVIGAILAYCALVFVIVVVQAVSTFGQ